jgi:hypothetical protein
MFFGGLFLTIPVAGHFVVLGYLGSIAIYGIENAIVVGGMSPLGAALYGIGVPMDSVIQYETAVKADSYLVMAHGTAEEMAREEDPRCGHNDHQQGNAASNRKVSRLWLNAWARRRLGLGLSLSFGLGFDFGLRRGLDGSQNPIRDQFHTVIHEEPSQGIAPDE